VPAPSFGAHRIFYFFQVAVGGRWWERIRGVILVRRRRGWGVDFVFEEFLRASSRMRELMEDADNSMVAFKASEYLLRVGTGIAPPVRTSTAVNIAIGGDVRAGFVIDLSEPAAAGDRREVVVEPGSPAPALGPVIDVTPQRVDE
jgi:hypothetical protein